VIFARNQPGPVADRKSDRGTSTLLIGPAGTGKSTISTLFAVAAAKRAAGL